MYKIVYYFEEIDDFGFLNKGFKTKIVSENDLKWYQENMDASIIEKIK